jgi:hypothetical protein
MNARRQWLTEPQAPLSPEEVQAFLEVLPPTGEQVAEAQLERREREVRALQAAWVERAAIHEELTRAGVPAGDALTRVRWLIAQWRKP